MIILCIGGEKILASRKGAAEGGGGGNSAAPERSAGAKRRRVSSVQKMFEQSCIIPPISNFPIFARPIRPREARKGMETLAPPPEDGRPNPRGEATARVSQY